MPNLLGSQEASRGSVELRQFLPQSYDMKSIADYRLGPDTDIPLERAAAAIDTAEGFITRVAELMT